MGRGGLRRRLDLVERTFNLLEKAFGVPPSGGLTRQFKSIARRRDSELKHLRIIALAAQECFIYHLTMDVTMEAPAGAIKDLAEIAALIGEPTRVVMLWSLLGGQARPASELAFYANVSAQNASAHLTRLVEAGLLAVEAQGRHRYYRLAGADIAHAIEALAALVPSARETAGLPQRQTPDLKYARTCYDHLAGRVAVEICAALKDKGCLNPVDADFEITDKGEKLFHDLGIEIDELRQQRRALARQC